jgi:hypothetical protein
MRVLQWVLDNLFTVLIIAGVLAQMIQAVKGRKGGDDDAGPTVEPPQEQEFGDPELAERTRRIREDIRRKIADRQAGRIPANEPEPELASEPTAYDEPPPVVREVAVERAEPPPPVVVASSRLDAQRQAEILEQQAALLDKMRQLEETKAAAQRRAAFEASTVSPIAAARTQARGALLGDLRDPVALRRAFVLREVLGPPVGLR